ncbi:hypothetical protein P7C71_g4332, partial [Lecanoromycetidae sp. Uapishka_2]
MLFGYDGEKGALYERFLDTHKRHGEKWGYPTHVLRKALLGNNILFDTDLMLVNQEIQWEVFLPPETTFPDIHFLATNEPHWSFNAGLFFMRVNDFSLIMLIESLSMRFRPDLFFASPEQDAMNFVMEQEGYRDHVIYQPRHWYNLQIKEEGEDFYKGAMSIHFRGWDPEEKLIHMREWLGKTESDPQQFNIPLSQLNLTAEIDEYWATALHAKNMIKRTSELPESILKTHKGLREADEYLREALWRHADNVEELKNATASMEEALTTINQYRPSDEIDEPEDASNEEMADIDEDDEIKAGPGLPFR